jgi:molecular chaperone GrpE
VQDEANTTGEDSTGPGAEAPSLESHENGAAAPAQDDPQDHLVVITEERNRYLDQLQRSLAEFANYRKRVDQERLQARKIATRDLLAGVVPIADDFRRAMEAIPANAREEPWVKGVELIERNLNALLEREGVRPVEALGQPFDPAMHEAVAVEPGTSGTTVVDVFQTGYWHGDQLLRPAVVKVGDPVPTPQ